MFHLLTKLVWEESRKEFVPREAEESFREVVEGICVVRRWAFVEGFDFFLFVPLLNAVLTSAKRGPIWDCVRDILSDFIYPYFAKTETGVCYSITPSELGPVFFDISDFCSTFFSLSPDQLALADYVWSASEVGYKALLNTTPKRHGHQLTRGVGELFSRVADLLEKRSACTCLIDHMRRQC